MKPPLKEIYMLKLGNLYLSECKVIDPANGRYDATKMTFSHLYIDAIEFSFEEAKNIKATYPMLSLIECKYSEKEIMEDDNRRKGRTPKGNAKRVG